MASIESLRARHESIRQQYYDHYDFVKSVQEQAGEELLPLLEEELELDEVGRETARIFLSDTVTVFRFCRRARFSLPAALKLLHITLAYRLTSTLLTLSPQSIPSLYLTEPLFFFHPLLKDRFGRPCAVLNLRFVRRTEDGELEGLKNLVRLGWEVGRKWLSDLSGAKQKGKESETNALVIRHEGEREIGDEPRSSASAISEPSIQMVVIVDLEGAGMSNLEVELLPFFMDLLKNHFPGMVGAIFVLNYGWMYSGMWQLAKRVLPNTALERILFPSKSELLEFFDEDHLLIEHGGSIKYKYTPGNPILAKYGRPTALTTSPQGVNAYPSPSPSPIRSAQSSRVASFESLASEVFHSVPGTPSGSQPTTPALILGVTPSHMKRAPSGLSMTSLSQLNPNGTEGGHRPGALWGRRTKSGHLPRESQSDKLIRRVPSLADLQIHLAETQAAIESDSSGDELDLDAYQDRSGRNTNDTDESASRGMGEQEYFSRDSAAREYARTVARSGWGGMKPLTPGSASNHAVDQGGVDNGKDAELREDDEEGDESDGTTVTESNATTSIPSSRLSSRVTSRNVSQATSREASPRRRAIAAGSMDAGGEGTFSTRAVKYTGTYAMSPYNASNPHFGYPAFVPPTSLDPSGIPRPHHHRRRKRDLVRTLTYLAVLRFLSLHRNVQLRLVIVLQVIVRITGLKYIGWGGGARSTGADSSSSLDGRAKGAHVRWQDDGILKSQLGSTNSLGSHVTSFSGKGSKYRHRLNTSNPEHVDIEVLYVLILFVCLRTPRITNSLDKLFLSVPRATWGSLSWLLQSAQPPNSLSNGTSAAATALSTTLRGGSFPVPSGMTSSDVVNATAKRIRKRDFFKRFVGVSVG